MRIETEAEARDAQQSGQHRRSADGRQSGLIGGVAELAARVFGVVARILVR